jgi:hypothetical protein
VFQKEMAKKSDIFKIVLVLRGRLSRMERALGEVLMSGFDGVAKIFALLCILAAPLAAEELSSASNNTPELFSVFATDPGNPGQTPNSGPAVEARSRSMLPRVSPAQPASMSGREKWSYYLKSTYGLKTIGFSVLGAGAKQAMGSVPEWGGGVEGYGKRLGSGFGQRVMERSIKIGFNGLLREDPRYYSSDRTGFWRRTLYAVGQTFVVHKDAGGTRIAFSRLAGDFGGAYLSRQWHPDSYHTAGNYFRSGFKSIGMDAARNIVAEFWPNLKKILHH